ncbi:MAG: hypothetical protein R2731_12530 [Nocardioides sp.]
MRSSPGAIAPSSPTAVHPAARSCVASASRAAGSAGRTLRLSTGINVGAGSWGRTSTAVRPGTPVRSASSTLSRMVTEAIEQPLQAPCSRT